MTTDVYQSSDSVRSGKPLKYLQTVTFDEPLVLERGDTLSTVTVAFETYGQLSADKDNAILMCHALSGDSHIAAHDENDDPGWWDIAIGPGRAIDTDRYFVVCPNILGGCRGTTGPNSPNPATGRPYGPDFPVITVGDMVEVQRRLIDHLGIDRLLAIVGGSLGGHMALHWATRLPDRVLGTVAVATSPRLTSQAIAFDVIGRNAILRDPHYHAGQYYDQNEKPLVGLAIARMLGHITYLSREAMMQKFDDERLRPRDIRSDFETKFSVGSYLAYQGDRFGERFDANSYLTLSMALDLFDLGGTVEQLREQFSPSQCRWLLMSFSSDWIFPPFQSRQMADALVKAGKPVTYCNIESNCGHDAFLLEDNLHIYGGLIHSFLDQLPLWKSDKRPGSHASANGDGKSIPAIARTQPNGGGPPSTNGPFSDDAPHHHPLSIFAKRHRLDYDSIAELIEPAASVLDLGCGTGGLLARLRRRNDARRLVGVELDEAAILASVQRGFDVLQADLNQANLPFDQGEFDVVVLSRTLQTVIDVDRVISEVLRVGRRGIVSFPNLAYHKLQDQLVQTGRAPRVEAEEGFHWYDTPNVRFLTIWDFEEFCQEKQITIHHNISLDTRAASLVKDDPNRNADLAVMVISR